MKKIPLTQGKVAIVDDEDFVFLNRLSWHAKTRKGTTHAVMRIRQGKPGQKKDALEITIYMEQFLIKVPNNYKIGHINRDTLDCRKSNLRQTTQSKSLAYARKRSGTISDFKGVSYHKNQKGYKKWFAKIQKNNKKYFLGYFETEIEAAIAYNKKARELYGEFAYENEV